jgi:predicted negative regulator of RcsB-dependent stress response
MASPSNASEPESPEEEEIIEAGFDPLYFWDRYRQLILLTGGVILLGLVGFAGYKYTQTRRVAAAGAALAGATTEADYRQVIDQYPGTVAAGDAYLYLAAALRDERKYDDALQILDQFMAKYPAHPLVSAADLSCAETLDVEGKKDDAIAKYEEVAAKYPDSFSAPLAIIAEANIAKAQGKTEDARRLYENLMAQFPDSAFAQQAMAEMHLLRPAPGAAAPAASPEGLPALQNAAPAASAAPSAAAPVIPVVPGSSQ